MLREIHRWEKFIIVNLEITAFIVSCNPNFVINLPSQDNLAL